MLRLITMLTLLLILSCGPELVVEPINNRSTLYLTVSPDNVERTVIIADALPVDTFIMQPGSGVLTIDTLPYGTYSVKVTAPGFGTLQEFFLLNTLFINKTMKLGVLPAQLERYYPYDNRPVGTRVDNTSFTFWFNTTFDRSALKRLITFTPEAEFRIDSIYYDHDWGQMVKITHHPADIPEGLIFPMKQTSPYIPPIPVRYDTLTITLSDTVPSVFGETLEFSFVCSYLHDRRDRQAKIAYFYLTEFRPSGTYVDISSVIDFEFRSKVVDIDIQSKFHIEPAVSGTLEQVYPLVGNHKYRFIPGDDLKSGQTYRITLDSTIQFEDSTRIRGGLGWEFTTRPLSLNIEKCYPRIGTTMAVPEKPFLLVFNTSIDSTSLVNGISIDPPLDSLSFSLTESRDSVFIHHAALQTETTYRLTVDSTVTDRQGASLRYPRTITFEAE